MDSQTGRNAATAAGVIHTDFEKGFMSRRSGQAITISSNNKGESGAKKP